MTDNIKENLKIKGENYQLFSQYHENNSVVYRNFMVSQSGKPVLLYDLGITKTALISYNVKGLKTSDLLYNLGKKFITEMIKENIFPVSGVITSHDLSKGKDNWKELKPLELNKDYTY